MPRPSPVSDEVIRQLGSGRRHAWSLAELLEAVRRRAHGANYSTVFRSVTALENAGVVDRLDVGDGASRYEMRAGHHEHVRCESCGRIDAIPACAVDVSARRIREETGFSIKSHQVVFVGRCADCARSSAAHHTRHLKHRHHHGKGCGHVAIPHGDHVDYMHGGHRHAAHGDHWDEH